MRNEARETSKIVNESNDELLSVKDAMNMSLDEIFQVIFKKGKVPSLKTESDYWELMEALGGFVFYTNHDTADGRIELSNKAEYKLFLMQRASQLLVEELEIKFGIIAPAHYPVVPEGIKLPHAPYGKIYYRDWYGKMGQKMTKMEFRRTICYGCPFCNEEEENFLGVPCDAFDGWSSRMFMPWECLMLDEERFMGREAFFELLRTKGGEETVDRFQKKYRKLKLEWANGKIKQFKGDISENRKIEVRDLAGKVGIFLKDGFIDETETLIDFITEKREGTVNDNESMHSFLYSYREIFGSGVKQSPEINQKIERFCLLFK